MSEIDIEDVGLVLGTCRGAELIGPGTHDRCQQMLQIEFRFDKVLGQGVEQLGIAWRIGRPDVIDWLDQAPTHEIAPKSVDDVSSNLL